MEVSQRSALRQHSRKTLCPISADQIASDLQVSNTICPGCSDEIAVEIEVSQRCALRQHSCKTLCCICADQIASELEVSQRLNWPRHNPSFLQAFSKLRLFSSPVDWDIVNRAADSHSEGVLEES
jgi:hypothetical protein